MAELTLVFWRDIPAQVIARGGRRSAKRVLSERFQEAIDRAAMRAGLRDSDAYLNEWRRVPAGPCDDDLEAAAADAAARIEASYPEDRLRALAMAGGLDPSPQGQGS